MKDIFSIIAKYIKTNRISVNKTQKELAEEVGVSLMTLRRAENGETLSVATLIALIEVFGELEEFKHFFTMNENTPRMMVGQKQRPRERVRKRKQEEEIGWVWGDSVE
jgi:transcriptional regulator with XRE-family HTH domain